MRISAKGRYALAAMIHLGRHKEGECIPLIQIADTMDISKIYLEQVFSLLKRAGLVSSVKGSQGGYKLTRISKDISIYDIMIATEAAIFEVAKGAAGKAKDIEKALDIRVFGPLDDAVKEVLSARSLADLVEEAANQQGDGYMFFI